MFNALAVVVNAGGSVTIIDVQQRRVLRTIAVGSLPQSAVVVGPSSSPVAYVANNGSGSLSVVDLNAFRVVRSVFVGGRPRGVTAVGAPGSERVLATN